MIYELTHKKFYEALKEGKLLGLKCIECGGYTAPPKITCSECGSMNMIIKELKGEGKIKTYTVIRIAPKGFRPPYIVAMVELEEGPWLMGNLENYDPELASIDLIGKKVSVSCKVVDQMDYTSGDAMAVTFNLL